MKTFKEFIAEAKHVMLAPNGGGSWSYERGRKEEKPTITNHPTEKTVGNEPFKDVKHFRQPKMKKYLKKMRKNIAKIPPVLGTPHPEDSSVQSIVDGNHRRRAAINARASSIPVEKVSHRNVRLLHPEEIDGDSEPSKKAGTSLHAFKDKKTGKYDMDRPRKRLGGKTLRDYFVNPDGSHNYKDE